jgi:hypothetical protein
MPTFGEALWIGATAATVGSETTEGLGDFAAGPSGRSR